MSFFSRLFGRSKPKEPTDEEPVMQPPAAPKVNGKVAPAPMTEERAQQIEARAKQDTVPIMSAAATPSGDASQPAAKKPTAGLFKKRAPSGGKLEAMPNAGLGVAVAAPVKEVQARVAVTPI